jgi:hypothetical protein
MPKTSASDIIETVQKGNVVDVYKEKKTGAHEKKHLGTLWKKTGEDDEIHAAEKEKWKEKDDDDDDDDDDNDLERGF